MTATASGEQPDADVVVVLSYFGADDTEECVESLLTGSPGVVVLVVDNGSFDGVIERVRARWPHVETLQTGENLGFSGGMNRGLEWALEAGAGTVTVLNNDTILPPNAIPSLVHVARTGVVVSPLVLYADGTGRVWFGGGVVDPSTSLARHLSSVELAERPADPSSRLRRSEVLAGCCLTASADTWRHVGLFDNRFFLNFEDSEWSIRASRRGAQLVVDTGVAINHRVSASFTGSYSYLGLFYYTRNGLLFGAIRGAWNVPVRMRFLRRHVAPVLLQDLRLGKVAELARHLVVISVAVSTHVLHRYGRAPRWLERATERWAQRRPSNAGT